MMAELRWTDTRGMDYSEDTRFPGIGVKVLEGKAINPTLSMVVVRIEPGRGIPMHMHPVETETAYLLAGTAVLTVEGVEHVWEAGMSVTIPNGLAHSLRNSGSVALDIVAVHSPPTR
jgi:quercetin dioxygenase-like cupin family protein